MKVYSQDSTRKSILRFLIYFNFFCPTFVSVFENASFGIGTAILHFSITLLCMTGIFIGNIQKNKIIIIALIYFTYFFVLISISVLLSPNAFTLRDSLEFHRPFYYGSAFILAAMIQWDRQSIREYIIQPLVIGLTIEIFVGLIFSLHLGPIEVIQLLYTRKESVNVLISAGTFNNSYDYGMMMVLMIIYYLNRLVTVKKNRFLNLLVMICAIPAILFAQSKTAVIITICAAVYYVVFTVFSHANARIKKRVSIYAVITIVVIVIFKDTALLYLEQNFSYIYHGIDALLSEGVRSKGHTLSTRFGQLDIAMSVLHNGYFFGYGPSKTVQSLLEMQYSLYLYRYGIPGITIVLMYFIYSIFISCKLVVLTRQNQQEDPTISFFIAFHVWCVMLPIASFGNAFIDMPRISFFFFSLIGVGTSICFGNMKDSNVLSVLKIRVI